MPRFKNGPPGPHCIITYLDKMKNYNSSLATTTEFKSYLESKGVKYDLIVMTAHYFKAIARRPVKKAHFSRVKNINELQCEVYLTNNDVYNDLITNKFFKVK